MEYHIQSAGDDRPEDRGEGAARAGRDVARVPRGGDQHAVRRDNSVV